MNEFWEAIVAAFFWFLEGVLGTLAAVTRFHTDVPWYQCLVSQLILLAFGFGMDVLITRWRKAIRRKKGQSDPNPYE